MAFVRSIVLACVVVSCTAFNPTVSVGRVGSLRKSVSYAPAAPKTSNRRAAASNIAMKGYELDLTGKVISPWRLARLPHVHTASPTFLVD